MQRHVFAWEGGYSCSMSVLGHIQRQCTGVHPSFQTMLQEKQIGDFFKSTYFGVKNETFQNCSKQCLTGVVAQASILLYGLEPLT